MSSQIWTPSRFGATKPPAHPEVEEGIPETSENLHILSAREYFIEFCGRESFKTYTYFPAGYATLNPVCAHFFFK
jgi:hypothetical protein